jgi:phosphate-selective porin
MIVLQNTNSETRSAYRMVKLLSLGGATYSLISASGPFHNLKALDYSKTMELDEKCLKDTYSNSGSADRMVKLLQLGGATCC